ncbi:MAG: hypothetical protein WC628_03470 [Candidatus Omnitrophota bacterium]
MVDKIDTQFCLIVFDLHPDWDSLPPRFACGSWVSASLKNKNILKCILMGVSSEDISTWNIQSADFSALKNNRLEIYPYVHKPSIVFLKPVPENISLEVKRGLLNHKISWGELKGRDLSSDLLSIIKRLPSKKVYLSIDKDCLSKDYALTNWEGGVLPLEELLLMLKVVKENVEIIGVDITGDYSPAYVSGKLKALCSRLDHPKDFSAKGFDEAHINAANEATNLKILQLLVS